MTVKFTLNLYEDLKKEQRTIHTSLEKGAQFIVGRGQGVHLWINDKNISREHCAIVNEDDQLCIIDYSRNGTYLNATRIRGRTALKNNDEIKLAKNVIQITIHSKAAGGFSLVGQTFKGYRVESVVGSGAVAVVYKGTQLAMNRPVAIKTLAQRYLTNPSAIKRFMNVAKVAGQLMHPYIVQIYDTGALDQYGIYYIVMEYVAGENLRDILKREKKMPLQKAGKIIAQIASALVFANKKSIVHRDINPSNIMVGKNDVAKLIGLGLSKSLDDEVTALTQPGRAMGMLGFISPEQLTDASSVDHRSDIYSMGAVLYQLLTGQTPYDTRNKLEYFRNIHERIPPTPPHEIDPSIIKPVSDIIMKALAADKNERYQRAELFLQDLKKYLIDEGIGLERARKNIMAMLPSPSSVPGLEFDSIFRPCREIGGDFYDFIELNEDEIGIVIGDVTGHGLEAAVIVGMAKSMIKIFGKQCHSTSEALVRTNAEIFPDLDSTTFVSVFYGIINRKTRQLRFSRAGHSPLIVYNPKRKTPFSIHEPKGMVLGMTRDEYFFCEEVNLTLQPGDLLIEYTDGVTEAMNKQQEEFGIERLCRAIERAEGAATKDVLASIDKALARFTAGVTQEDDITVIAIKVL